MDDMKKHIEALIGRAAAADKSDDAMKFSQAAVNAANALCALHNAKPSKE